MYANDYKILQLTVLLLENGIEDIVIAPGARNAALAHSFANTSSLRCHRIVDERSAAFYALGMAEASGKPVAVCCTSGTAVLNLTPAVAEASLRGIRILILTADRPRAMINQLEGQTLTQNGIFQNLVAYAASLPEGTEELDKWHTNRLLNEAFIALNDKSRKPVHINIPLREPLFDFSVEQLPKARRILQTPYQINADISSLIAVWESTKKKIILVGQTVKDEKLGNALQKLQKKHDCVIFAELLGNLPTEISIGNFDLLLAALPEEKKQELFPDLIISIGGHLVSKRIKSWIRSGKIEHWHISPTDELPDLFFQMSRSVRSDLLPFFENLDNFPVVNKEETLSYKQNWEQLSKAVPAPVANPQKEETLNELYLTARIAHEIPEGAYFHVGNSSSIRNLQLFPAKANAYLCNRGVSGIEGSLSTAIGYSAAKEGEHFLLIGDLSFFYDMNALAIDKISPKFKVILVNNGGGAIFHQIKGLQDSNILDNLVAHHHKQKAENWVKSCNWNYYSADNKKDFEDSLALFLAEKNDRPSLLEVFTEIEKTTRVIKRYFGKVREGF